MGRVGAGRVSAGRVVLGALGVAGAAYGGWLLVQRGFADLVATAVWLGAGVVGHDGLLAPLTLLAGLLAARLLPRGWLGPAARFGVLVGPVTLLAVPVLGRFGARADNATLLDRAYWPGWALLVGLCLVGVAVGAWLEGRSGVATRRDDVP
ncbi:hypothetical protein [Nocardioides sp.]|uniref:hypothetical protein n=1 Tax=Nocardioides sp. TaxID=35761 RepID=UPI003528F297